MRFLKYFFTFAFVVILTSSVFSQNKKNNEEDEPPTYGGIEIPGYISASASFTYGAVKGNFKINSLALNGNSNDYMLPELDVEVGIVDRLSLEMVTGYRKIVSTATLTTKNNRSIKLNQTTSGLNSIMLGANIGILSEKGYRPAMYLQNQFYLPKTGQTTFQNEEPGYFAILNMENTLSDVTYIDYGIGGGWDGTEPNANYNLSINPNFYVSDDVILYADYSGMFTNHYEPLHMIDIGTTITFSDLFSIDAYIGNQLQTKNFAKSSFGAIKFTFDFNAFAK